MENGLALVFQSLIKHSAGLYTISSSARLVSRLLSSDSLNIQSLVLDRLHGQSHSHCLRSSHSQSRYHSLEPSALDRRPALGLCFRYFEMKSCCACIDRIRPMSIPASLCHSVAVLRQIHDFAEWRRAGRLLLDGRWSWPESKTFRDCKAVAKRALLLMQALPWSLVHTLTRGRFDGVRYRLLGSERICGFGARGARGGASTLRGSCFAPLRPRSYYHRIVVVVDARVDRVLCFVLLDLLVRRAKPAHEVAVDHCNEIAWYSIANKLPLLGLHRRPETMRRPESHEVHALAGSERTCAARVQPQRSIARYGILQWQIPLCWTLRGAFGGKFAAQSPRVVERISSELRCTFECCANCGLRLHAISITMGWQWELGKLLAGTMYLLA